MAVEGNQNEVVYRSEEPRDYPGIAAVHAEAFADAPMACEVALVDSLRHQLAYTPALSVVAEESGRIIGHILLTPVPIRMSGTLVNGAILAPLAVAAPYQGQGIGSRLVEEAHRRAAALGIDMVMLLGHSMYYPRFGYQTGMFGRCGVEVSRQAVLMEGDATSQTLPTFEARRVRQEDVPKLQTMWQDSFSDVDLAMAPGDSIADWISASQAIASLAFCLDGHIMGYARIGSETGALRENRVLADDFRGLQSDSLRLLLAKDEENLAQILRWVSRRLEFGTETLGVPICPGTRAAARLESRFAVKPVVETWDAAMICVLNHHPVVANYCDEVSANKRVPGMVVWPVAFDLC